MKITLKEGRDLIAPHVNKCAEDEDALNNIIFLAMHEAWDSGDWWGMRKRVHIRIIDDRIVLPPQFGALEAINQNGVPRMLHNEWYEFSPNGPGTRYCDWHRGVFDQLEVPTLWKIAEGEQVLATSDSKNGEDIGLRVTIQGTNTDGRIIYRYYSNPAGDETIPKSDLGEQIEVAWRDFKRNGAQFTSASKTYSQFAHDGISDIFKPATRGPIDIWAAGPRYIRLLTTMEPSQTQSSLRAYRVPEGCRCGDCVDALVKLAEPEKPTQDHEVLQIQSPTALISLCMSVYYKLYTMDPEKAAIYFADGMRILNGQRTQQNGGNVPMIQVFGPSLARNKARQGRVY